MTMQKLIEDQDLDGKNMFIYNKVTSGIVKSEKDCKSIKGMIGKYHIVKIFKEHLTSWRSGFDLKVQKGRLFMG